MYLGIFFFDEVMYQFVKCYVLFAGLSDEKLGKRMNNIYF